jgi:hypothetical protein
MNLDTTKEEILQFKWKINHIVKNKTEAVTDQNWEAAAGFRDEEKIVRDCLQTMKSEIREELINFNQSPSENKNDLVLLEELLLLIDSSAGYNDTAKNTSPTPPIV